MSIQLKSPAEIAKLREANLIVADVLDALEAAAKPGLSTWELNDIAAVRLKQLKGESAFLGYHGYPAVLCTSVNEVVVHGIPRKDVILAEGDVIGIDFACFKDGYAADAARTVAVGVISQPARALIDATRESLMQAIARCVPGARLGDVSNAVQRHAEAHGYSVVRDLVGHGIGRAMHEPPSVPNFGRPGLGLRLEPGLVIAIEPMLNARSPDVHTRDDAWTIATDDGGLSAHFEHTVAITEAGPEILTA